MMMRALHHFGQFYKQTGSHSLKMFFKSLEEIITTVDGLDLIWQQVY